MLRTGGHRDLRVPGVDQRPGRRGAERPPQPPGLPSGALVAGGGRRARRAPAHRGDRGAAAQEQGRPPVGRHGHRVLLEGPRRARRHPPLRGGGVRAVPRPKLATTAAAAGSGGVPCRAATARSRRDAASGASGAAARSSASRPVSSRGQSSSSGTRLSRSACASTPSTGGAAPGRKRIPPGRSRAGSPPRWGPVSGPATYRSRPSQITSTHPSGTTRNTWSAPPIRRVHTQATTRPSPTAGGLSRYSPRSPSMPPILARRALFGRDRFQDLVRSTRRRSPRRTAWSRRCA